MGVIDLVTLTASLLTIVPLPASLKWVYQLLPYPVCTIRMCSDPHALCRTECGPTWGRAWTASLPWWTNWLTGMAPVKAAVASPEMEKRSLLWWTPLCLIQGVRNLFPPNHWFSKQNEKVMIKWDSKRGVNRAFDESADSMLFHRSGLDDGSLFIKLHLSCVFGTACNALFFFFFCYITTFLKEEQCFLLKSLT